MHHKTEARDDRQMHAVNKDELVHATALPRDRDAERSSQRPQPIQSLVPEEYERAVAGPALKADSAIAQNFQQWRANFRSGLTCHPGDRVWRSAAVRSIVSDHRVRQLK
jgi:hypothetical protein